MNAVCARGGENFAYSFYGKLDEVERRISGDFVRVHQRYLVNPAKVIRIGNESVTMESAADIPMSRAMKERAVAKLARAMLEGEGS